MQVQFDTGNWLYILLGIAWVVYSIYKGVNKNQSKSADDTNPKKKSSFLDELIEGFTEENKAPLVDDPYAGADVNHWQEEPMQSIDNDEINAPIDMPPEEEGVPVRHPAVEPVSDEADVITKTHRKKKRINLKKAVIYSEILRRPYE
jgi:hypothetical protein